MKSKRNTICWLLGALAFATLAGCARDHAQGGYGGYEQDYGHRDNQVQENRDLENWNRPGPERDWPPRHDDTQDDLNR